MAEPSADGSMVVVLNNGDAAAAPASAPSAAVTTTTTSTTNSVSNDKEDEDGDDPFSGLDKSSLLAVLKFLKKNKLQETELILRKEAKLLNDLQDDSAAAPATGSDVTSVLSTYKSEGDPDIYEDSYTSFKRFVEASLDSYRHELAMVLYPAFVHMYLELVYNEHERQALKFMERFGPEQEEYYQEDVKRLGCLTKKDHMKGNEFMDNFRSGQFTVRMSRDTYNFLKRYLQDKKNSVLQNIVQEHLYLDVYEGIARAKAQLDATAGAFLGEAARQANKVKVYYGLLKEPELTIPLDEDDEGGDGEGGDKPKKKKPKKDTLLSKKARNDPNAPPNSRIPLPELRDADKMDKVSAMKEALKRVRLGPESLPSICFYTFLNSYRGVTVAEISEDSTLLAAGFGDSSIRVWTLTPHKLKGMKSAHELETIDKDAEDVLYRMMDDRSGVDVRHLLGHSGPVTAVSFSPDHLFLLSSSEDSTIRLWSLLTWTNVVCYRGHCFPVWDVRFSPHGYYFASSGHDRTARLWSTDSYQPLRVFTGHVSDVDCIQFHHNSNYIATGSSDRTVRLWDVLSGGCVRYMTGHKGRIYCLQFSNDGRFLASAGADCKILMWDIAHGHLLAELSGHTDTIYCLCFSRDTAILASGGIDNCIKLWDFARLIDEIDLEDLNISHAPTVRTNCDGLLLGSYPTKATSILALHFTRRNLLLAAGMYQSGS
ncbi:TATA-box binding protein associated factor 5 isoform X1 [Rhipicephalus microplus]|uniref:TATA-box binding protein associated factor 5 isoform X1 n=1 Tax=Rhipicephalus microplus TaxID=6941 RepID=UPI003F6C0B35